MAATRAPLAPAALLLLVAAVAAQVPAQVPARVPAQVPAPVPTQVPARVPAQVPAQVRRSGVAARWLRRCAQCASTFNQCLARWRVEGMPAPPRHSPLALAARNQERRGGRAERRDAANHPVCADSGQGDR